MPNVWPALDEDGVSLTVLDHNGNVIPVNGVTVTSGEYASFYSDIVFTGRLLTYDPIGIGGVPNTLYSAGALDAVTSDAVLGTIRGDFDGQQAKTNDNNFWMWDAASTASASPATSTGGGVLAPNALIAGRWLQTLPTGSGGTGTGDWTGAASANTVTGIRNIATTAAPTDGTYYRASSSSGNTYTTTATFTATAASGAIIPAGGYAVGATNGCQYLITVAGTEGIPTPGAITVTISGTGPNAAIASGATVYIYRPAAGVNGSGTTNAAIVVPSSELRLAPSPITDITKRVISPRRMPNGDTRPGIFPNTVTSSVKALNAMFASCNPSDTVQIEDNFYIDDTLVIGDYAARATNSAFSVYGLNEVANNDAGKTSFIYTGPNDRPAVLVSANRMRIGGMCIRTTTSPTALMDIDNRFAAGNVRLLYFENMHFYNQLDTVASMVRINPSGVGVGNFDDIHWLTCRWQNSVTACVEVPSGSQPYTMVFDRCQLYGYSNTIPRGAGVYTRNTSTSYVFIGCDLQQLESCIWTTRDTRVAMYGCQFEHTKKLVYADNPSVPGSATGVVITLDGASRASGASLGFASSGPIGFSASDQDVIYIPGQGSLSIDGLDYGGTGAEQPKAKIHVGRQTAIYIKNIVWPTFEVLRRDQPAAPGAHTEISGTCYNGSGYYPLNDYKTGTSNSGGKIWIYGASTSQVVQLPESEPDTSYNPTPSFDEVVGTPALSDVWTSDKTTTSFKINLGVAPGGSNARGIRWVNSKGRKKISTPTDLGGTVRLWLRPGVSMTTGGGTCSAWADAYGNTFAFSGSQPVYVAANANLNGLDTIRLTAGTTQSMQSSLAASSWEWMSDGTTPVFMWAVVYHSSGISQIGYAIGTKTSTSSARGVGFKHELVPGDRVSLGVADGAAQGGTGQTGYTVGKRAWLGRISRPSGPAVCKTSVEALAWSEAADLGGIVLNAGTPQSTFRLQNLSTTTDLDIAEVGVVSGADLSTAVIDSFLQNYLVPLYGGLVSP